MNNEPVAWMLADKEAEHIRSIMAVQHDFVPEGCVEIPLYTHPVQKPMMVLDGNRVYPVVKELTDEEIWDVIDDCFGVHAFNLDYQIALDEAREDAFELVKAILRKAQE